MNLSTKNLKSKSLWASFSRLWNEASRWDRTWLRDWDDDTIRVSADLYEILTACSNMRPGA
ncbi:MAG: hypothetical protein R3C11_17500 [Planctomycetaceae bacterium]